MPPLPPRWILVKAVLFAALIGLAVSLLLLASPTVTTALACVVLMWASARVYYFAFYVIEHYVDGDYRFSGLCDFARWLWRGGWRQLAAKKN